MPCQQADSTWRMINQSGAIAPWRTSRANALAEARAAKVRSTPGHSFERREANMVWPMTKEAAFEGRYARKSRKVLMTTTGKP